MNNNVSATRKGDGMKMCLLISFLIGYAGLSASARGQDNTKKGVPCALPEAGQFDFWVGDWDLEWDGPDHAKVKGSNTVQKILDGCVIQENFSDPSTSFTGMSVSMFNTHLNKWQQTWVDNQGSYLDFVGEFSGGRMVLERKALKKDGTDFLHRMIFYNISAKQLDWNWEKSEDKGKTWNLMWKIHYVRKSP
jgi:hypothetical protein